jgi:hypothetical protein
MEEIREGNILLRQCERCKLWHHESNLCTNEETNILECTQCYIDWRQSILDRKNRDEEKR